MAASVYIEEETGTFTWRHSHNGYYAGDFSFATPSVDQAPADLEAPVWFGTVRVGDDRHGRASMITAR